MRRFFPGATSFKSWSWVRAENILSVLSKTTRHELIATFTDNCWDVILKLPLFRVQYPDHLRCRCGAICFDPNLTIRDCRATQRRRQLSPKMAGTVIMTTLSLRFISGSR